MWERWADGEKTIYCLPLYTFSILNYVTVLPTQKTIFLKKSRSG